MQKVTLGYEPKDALGYFEAFSAIPRGSFNEKAVAEYIYQFGLDLGLESYIDESWNVMIKKPASAGCENAQPILLQGHTDIVCVKLPESDHQFETDPLPLYVENGMLKSKGTTLGADDGVAVAYMMALLSRNDIVHPALECAFTSMEEVGLFGAIAMPKEWVSAKRMINMDAGSISSGKTIVSCAGGYELKFTTTPIWQKASGKAIHLAISGLKGGHSAGAIDKGRGNAAKLMARILNKVEEVTPVNVATFYGGDKMNAIISACETTICVEDDTAALAVIEKVSAEIKEELKVTDEGYTCHFKTTSSPEKMLEHTQSKRFVQMALVMPSQVRDMSFEIEGHILCSTNLGAVQVNEDEILFWSLTRSGEDTRMVALVDEVKAIADVFGYKVETGATFFGWKYNAKSALRDIHINLVKEVFDVDLRVEAAHGGLECGIFYGKDNELDIIALSADSSGAHTPEETLNLASFNDTFEYLLKLLEVLTTK
ncbi:MAG: beta-Ala-His dipeptidase [Erysipelotrichaceae bacterium]